MRTIFIASIIIALSVLIDGCTQKGCTDKNALNYNAAADKDDGSCVYCKASSTQLTSVKGFLVDRNGGTNPYFQDTVAVFNITGTSMNYNDIKCGLNSCNFFLTIQNKINKQITVSFCEFEVVPLFDTTMDNIVIPANGTRNYNQIFSISNNSVTNCNPTNIDIFNTGTISYH
jgi:hypothetical protein